MVNKVEVSHKTIFFTVLFIITLWVLVQIKDILLLLFISFILMSALSTVVDNIEKMRVPRALAILLIYIIVLSVLGIVGSVIFPPLVTQSVKLISKLPDFINSVLPDSRIDIETIIQQVIPVGEGVVRFSVGIFSNFITIITLLVFTFYFLLERKKLEDDLINFIGIDAGKKIFSVITEVEIKLGAWTRGELALMTIIGITTYIGLIILKIDYALPLAIFAGILEIVPIIGPIISAVPAVLVAFSVSPGLALVVVVLYTLIQQLENHLIVPTVMRKAVGLRPLVTILALMIGGRLAGVGGALLAIPILLTLQVVVGNLLKSRLR